jgi:8-oxo-dGTP diphosphatase
MQGPSTIAHSNLLMPSEQSYCYSHPHPAVTTDVVLFTIRDEQLLLLLIRRGQPPFEGRWALPGGFLEIDEDPISGAARELAEETGVTGLALEQFRTFGAVGRDPRERVISIAHWALAEPRQLQVAAGDDAAEARWFPLRALPNLAFDHAEIIAEAHRHLSAGLVDARLACRFLPPTFTLDQLQRVYETLLDAEIDKRNLRTWSAALEQIEPTGEQRSRDGRPPARLYRSKTAVAM